MNALINVNVKDNGEYAVSARSLHEALGSKERFSKWFDKAKDYGFDEGIDYTPYQTVHPQNKQGITDYAMSLDMAKEVAMVSHLPRGKELRQYFISIEKDWNSPEKVIARALIMSQKKVQELTPFANVGKAISQTPDCIPVGDLAKILKQNGIDIGRTRLFEWLRGNGYIQYSNRTPTQKAMNLGLFRIIEQPVDNAVYHTTYVTGKGQQYFINKFTEVA
jgi:anti-repressor protein